MLLFPFPLLFTFVLFTSCTAVLCCCCVRYCGARIASGFNRGPWGTNTLCTPHYVNFVKHKLNLSAYKVLLAVD